jgi:hypothetical protein
VRQTAYGRILVNVSSAPSCVDHKRSHTRFRCMHFVRHAPLAKLPPLFISSSSFPLHHSDHPGPASPNNKAFFCSSFTGRHNIHSPCTFRADTHRKSKLRSLSYRRCASLLMSIIGVVGCTGSGEHIARTISSVISCTSFLRLLHISQLDQTQPKHAILYNFNWSSSTL